MADGRGGARPGAGRPSKYTKEVGKRLYVLCREHAEEAVNVLLKNMRSDDPNLAQSAAIAVLDRGFGKPTQAVEVHADVTTHQDYAIESDDPKTISASYQSVIAGAIGSEYDADSDAVN